MHIAISGGTGFVGKKLTKKLVELGHEVTILTRYPDKYKNEEKITYVQWLKDDIPKLENKKIDVYINLAGKSINTYWSEKNKRQIVQSRLHSTEKGIQLLESLSNPPKVYIQASAIGIYGTSLHDTFTEESSTKKTDFLASTVQQWEHTAIQGTKKLNIRTVLCRFGLILDNQEGALPKIVLPYKLFIGGKIGTGDQWVSWIHIDDVVNGIIFTIENETMEGAINFTAPNPVTMNELGKSISQQLRKPHWLSVPSFLVKAVLGEMSILILEGQKVLPAKLIQAGYQFNYEQIDDALLHLYKKSSFSNA